MLTYLINETTGERPWAPQSVCASELTLWSALPSVSVSAHVAPAAAGVSVNGVSGVEGVLVAQRPLTQSPLTMKPSRIQTTGTTGFTTAAEDNPTASKRIDAVSGVPPRGRPV